MATRNFNTAYMRAKARKELEAQKRRQEYDRLYKKLNQRHHKSEAVGVTIDEFLKFMELKANTGIFQSFDPRDFGADYDIVPIPKDGTPEAEFWLNEQPD